MEDLAPPGDITAGMSSNVGVDWNYRNDSVDTVMHYTCM